MIIVGAGMAGLIAAHVLRRYEPVVWEKQPGLPDNHGALLRFRTDAVAKATGIPFRRVQVIKAVKHRGRLWRDLNLTPDLHNRYSLKVTGQVRSRSIVDLSAGERYIAPDDFLTRLARGINIQHRISLEAGDVLKRDATDDPMISTIPMPALMGLAEWEFSMPFLHREVWSVTVQLPNLVDVYQTIYYPGSEPWYRASITGRKLIIEYMIDPQADRTDEDHTVTPAGDVLQVFTDFGLADHINPLSMTDPVVKYHRYGKLTPVDDDLRRAFILAMTDRHAIYSLGRFATWRQLLLDDIVKDVTIIEQFIDQRGAYQRKLAHSGRHA